jgi:KDO2-lipid IV(A) lauroyltransferase
MTQERFLRQLKKRLLIIAVHLLGHTPLFLNRLIGRGLGNVLYFLPGTQKRIVEINCNLCFPEIKGADKKALIRSILIENSITLIEMPGAWIRDPAYWAARIDKEQALQEMRALLKEGRGLILSVPHFGNWEVAAHVLTEVAPVTILYRSPRIDALEKIIVSGRQKKGARLVSISREGIKALYKALQRNEMILILPDQQPKNESSGVFAPFFGVQALTMTLFGRLANKSGAPAYMLYLLREAGGGFKLHGRSVSGDVASDDPRIAATVLNKSIESAVSDRIPQYLWSYKRFSIQPDGQPSPYKSSS